MSSLDVDFGDLVLVGFWKFLQSRRLGNAHVILFDKLAQGRPVSSRPCSVGWLVGFGNGVGGDGGCRVIVVVLT